MPKLTSLGLAIPFVLAACAHQPKEYDLTPQTVEPAPQGVSLQGTWTYNPEDSDQPGRMGGGGGYSGGRGRGGGFGGGFGGRGGFGGGRGRGGGGGGGGGGGSARGQGNGGEETDSTFRRPARRLVITQTDSTLTISPRDSVSYTLYFDGRDVPAPDALGGTRVRISGRWHKNRFEVSRELESGAMLTEGYEVKKHGERLVIHIRVSRGENEPTMPDFQRVYDRYGD